MSSSRNCLLIIDPQVDFHEGGSLAVAGATDDSERIANFIRKNVSNIDQIIVTLDSHQPDHIAHAKMWKDRNGDAPAPFTRITSQQIKEGVWTPSNGDVAYAIEYTENLERKGKFFLTIWPEHCIIGTPGHEIFPPLLTAIQDWASFHNHKLEIIEKGQNIKTEMYSALEAEIPDTDDPKTFLNQALLERLKAFDRVYVCGEALSHCVNYTVRDMLRYWRTEEKHKICVFRDATSPVAGCNREAEEFIAFVLSEGANALTTEEVAL